MHKQKIAILIAATLGILATFLPWVKMPIVGYVNGTQGNLAGWDTFVLYLVPLILCLVGKLSEPIKGAKLRGAVVSSIFASLYGVVRINEFNSKVSSLNKDNPFTKALSESVSIEIGLYLVVIAGLGVTIAAFFIKDPTAPISMEEKSSPLKPNDKIKWKIKRLHTLAIILLVLQVLTYVYGMNTDSDAPSRTFDYDLLGYLFINIIWIIAIILFIRAYFLSRKLNGENENANPNISDVQNALTISPITDPNTSHTNSQIEKISKLKELKELLDAGILNQQEYDNEKAKILSL